ncbi:gliding motility-associated C-terminal domain-containing protein [Ulvibacterium sp.]|uniref:gliding motility-associated C-terminal domain-containing protein n=1 Tax=Ulvibacterium sp. TaxID=2665914 RepID=UPI003BAD2527
MTDHNLPKTIFLWVLGLLLLGFSQNIKAQCAGTDNTVTVCEKDTDIATQNYTLFDKLNGTPTPGGIWSTNDPANFFALDRTNGIVNLWEVKNSGVHQFTYTNDSCGESAIVTINLGGYPGEDNIDGSADACGDNSAVNLHSYIGDETEGKFQDFNGTWAAITPEAIPHLNENFFDAEAAGPGIYEFTHTVPVVATCPSRQVRLLLEVQRPANSGIGSNLVVCTTDDLSGLTNYDLDALLFDEDSNGTWSEGPLTNELDDLTDHIINVEAIRDTHTSGTFTFRYTVFPSHAVCTVNTTAVDVVILPVLQGTMATVNYCEGPSEYTIEITNYDTSLIASGTYTATYSLTSASGTETDSASLTLNNDGTGNFQIDANPINLNEPTTLTITSLGVNVCSDIQVPPISFIVTDLTANAMDSCEGEAPSVDLTNIYDASSNIANGNYDVIYTLTAPSSAITNFTLNDVSFSSGSATFSIPAAQITETGEYEISLDVASGFPLSCQITDTFSVTPTPPPIDLDLLVDNSCDATQIEVTVDAPILSDGSYTITYDVTQMSTGQVAITNTINFTGGTASYELDVASLEQGNYTASVRSAQNDTTPCRLIFDFELSENFAIEGIPDLPIAEAQQIICLSSYAPDLPTLENIEVTATGEILFYATETDMDILPLDTTLTNGEDYYISNIDPTNNCEGSDRIRVTVTLVDPAMPVASNPNPLFCASDDSTVGDLNAVISSASPVVWFDAVSGGNVLENSVVLVDGQSYYAATEGDGQCLSTERLEIAPTVFDLEPPSLELTNLALCGLDNPTVSDLRDIEGNNPFEVLWYTSPENGNPLTNDVLLTEDTTYYAESFDPDTGCINPERIPVTVELSNCNPEDYGFFIPDGFSPNNDGRNDTFFIPNIEVIFPDFTLEILNRYGSTLFKGDRNNPAWDGDKAPNGVYFYVIEFNKQGNDPKQGRLYLNR